MNKFLHYWSENWKNKRFYNWKWFIFNWIRNKWRNSTSWCSKMGVSLLSIDTFEIFSYIFYKSYPLLNWFLCKSIFPEIRWHMFKVHQSLPLKALFLCAMRLAPVQTSPWTMNWATSPVQHWLCQLTICQVSNEI